MQLHNFTSLTHRRSKKRVGRGGKRGTYAGRGIKGQKARAGRHIRPALRDILKKIPKLRGYNQKQIPANLAVVNLKAIEKNFEAGGSVTPKTLLGKHLIRRISGKLPRVKILAGGSLSKPLEFKGVVFSKSAREAVEKAGGRITAY